MVDEASTTPVATNPFAVAATLNQPDSQAEPEEVKKDPVWLGDLIRDGFYDKVVLIGFPYDEGARKAGNRRGADFGPGKSHQESTSCIILNALTMVFVLLLVDSFRRFVQDVGSVRNPEYGVDIAAGIPNIADYGNIQIESELDQ